ncbi:MAG: hypothetical protein KDA42_12850 [Planctomycetales bacterium]|nr:hypothetical protein [Planctomycetales bacterium]
MSETSLRFRLSTLFGSVVIASICAFWAKYAFFVPEPPVYREPSLIVRLEIEYRPETQPFPGAHGRHALIPVIMEGTFWIDPGSRSPQLDANSEKYIDRPPFGSVDEVQLAPFSGWQDTQKNQPRTLTWRRDTVSYNYFAFQDEETVDGPMPSLLEARYQQIRQLAEENIGSATAKTGLLGTIVHFSVPLPESFPLLEAFIATHDQQDPDTTWDQSIRSVRASP